MKMGKLSCPWVCGRAIRRFSGLQCGEERIDFSAGERFAVEQLLCERRQPFGVIGQKRRDGLVAVGQQARGQRGGVGRGSARAL